jgi:hypothetical protein
VKPKPACTGKGTIRLQIDSFLFNEDTGGQSCFKPAPGVFLKNPQYLEKKLFFYLILF